MTDTEPRKTFEGVIPILATPFTPEGEVDEASFRRQIEAAIAGGAYALAMFGLASEYYKLSDSERSRLIQILVQQAAGRCPIIISITAHSTVLARREAAAAARYGADALMIMPPFFLAPSTAAILEHIREIATEVNLPTVVQYAPIQTGRSIGAEAFAELCRTFPHITHVKVDLVPSGPMISSLAAHGVASLVGYMGLHLPEDFSRGVSGVMPTVGIAPALTEIWRLLHENEAEARTLHKEILPLLSFMMQSVEFLIACEKRILVRLGIFQSPACREPAIHLDRTQEAELDMHLLRLIRWIDAPAMRPT